MSGERVVQIADATTGKAYRNGDPIPRAIADLGGVRTLLIVPLRKDDAVLGNFAIYRREVRPFSDKQIALLQNFASQAVIAMENARLLTETREALEQQTATAEVLGVINTSPGDLAPVFQAMLEKALHLCGATFGVMNRYDGEYFHHAADQGVPSAYANYRREKGPTIFEPETTPARLVAGENLIHIADLMATEVYERGDPARRALADLGGARTHLTAALRKGDVLLGFISIYRQEVRPFTDKQMALLQNFAAQAVIAIENARLMTETREALDQQTATAEVLGVINSSPGDLAPVFDAILEKAHDLCGAPLGSMVLSEGTQLRAVATRGFPQEYDAMARRGFSPNAPFRRILTGAPFVHAPDPATVHAPNPAAPEAPDKHDPMRRAALEIAGVRTALFVPLRKDATVLGYISAQRQEVRPFSEKQIALLQNFAAQAVVAMENARLLTETREALEQQTATAEVLQVINSSPGDLVPVFSAILEKAHSLCGAEHGILATYDGEHAHAVATHGIPGPLSELLRQPFRPSPNSPQTRVVREGRPIHIPDLMTEALWEREDPKRVAAIKRNGVRTMLFVPLRKDDIRLGWITANRLEVRPFSDKEIALLESFAAQAVIAMENARLLDELRQRTHEVAELNRGLEARVAEQVEELGRVGRLKRFLAPQLAELIVSRGDEKILESHRREIVVVFCDLRGYTAFTETAEPEEVLDFLRDYHGALGPLVSQFEGTLDQFSGDGIMVFFNDPVPILDPAERAVKMAVAMREAAGTLITDWRERGRDLGFGAGIAQGYATLGQIGFADRSGYTAIGTVCNVAARLCAEARDGQILLSQRVNVALKGSVATEQVGALALKGLSQPVVAYNVPLATNQPALGVIEGDPKSV
jgi:adenylate cyclase